MKMEACLEVDPEDLLPAKAEMPECSKCLDQVLVNLARAPIAQGGILTDPTNIKEKSLPTNTINVVQTFYQDDKISRQCP